MGCGASTQQSPEVLINNPGDLRDRSFQETVEIREGVAEAGKRSPALEKSAKASAPLLDQKAASSPRRPSSSSSSGVSSAQLAGVAQAYESAKNPPRPPSGTPQPPAPSPADASAKAAIATPRPASGTPQPPAPSPADADAKAAIATPRPASGAPQPPAPSLANAGAKAAITSTSARAAPSASPSPAATPTPAVQAAAATPTAPPTAQPTQPQQQEKQGYRNAQPQPRMVDCAVSLKFLIDFCRTVPQDMPTWKVVTDVIVPATKERRCRYVELLEPTNVGKCDYFISHRWATPFSHLVRYVCKHLVELGDVREGDGGEAAEDGKGKPGGDGGGIGGDDGETRTRRVDQVFVWCDIFAINQHPGQVQADDLAQLKDCVEASDQTLLCLDDQGLVLTRIWCLYEIWNTVLAGGPPKLAVLGYDVNPDSFKDVYITLDVSEAQATVESDRDRILADIAASTGLQELNLVIKEALVESTQAEAETAQKVFLPKAKDWKDYERVIQAINKHTQMLVAVGRHQESQRYGYIIQSVSAAWQKNSAAKPGTGSGATEAAAADTAASKTAGAGAGAAAGAAAAAVPTWHWSQYPKEPSLRQIVERAEAAEKSGRFDAAMTLLRDAVANAQERKGQLLKQKPPPPSASKPGALSPAAGTALDLAGCQMRLGIYLVSRGFIDQACDEAGRPAVSAFEEHCGLKSLTYASAAYQMAVLGKNNWQIRELRSQLLDRALAIQETQLGPNDPVTLDTLREKAEALYMGGDFPGGVALFHKLAVRLSGGVDLVAPKTPPHGGLSAKAMEAWFLLASYLGNMDGREEEGARVCRGLIPHRRRTHIQTLYDTATAGGEYAADAAAELRRLGLPDKPPPPPAAAGKPSPYDNLLPGLSDPDSAKYDMISHTGELSNISTALAKKGRMEEAVRLQWRLADVFRSNKSLADMETQLSSGKVSMVDAYEQCLFLDMSVPGAAKAAQAMLVKESGRKAAGSAGGAGGGAAATAGTLAAPAKPAYDGPRYMELVTEMSKLWGQQDYPGAEVLCRRIIECQAAGYGPGSKEVVDAKMQLARLLQTAGRLEEALEEMQGALKLHEKILHGKDPTMVYTLHSLADMYEDRTEAEKLHRRALALVEKVYGPDHSEVGSALMKLGGFLMANYERLAEGQEMMQRGMAIHQKFQERQAAKGKAF